MTTAVFNIEKVRDAYSARQAKKRDAAYAKQREWRMANPGLDLPMPVTSPSYRYVKEIWNTHLIVKGDANDLYKVPYTVGPDGASFTFGKEVAVTEQYVELSHADEDGLLAEWDDTDHRIGVILDLADSEHVPNKPGKANWVEKVGGLPEYINRIAKDLMQKGMDESHAIATAVNQVKKWAAGGPDVKPDTRAKAAAALAEWESKKAASHTSLSTPARLDSGRRGRVHTVDLAAVLDRAARLDDPRARAAVRLKVLDLVSPRPPGVAAGGGAVDSGRSYSLDELATKRAKFLLRAAAKAKKGGAKKAGSRKTKKSAGKKSKFVKPPERVKPVTAGGLPKWTHGWVPANDAARAAVKANPQKYARMRAKQGGQPSSKSRRSMALSVPPGVTIDLAGTKPGQRFRHGWIPINPGSNTSLGKALRANPPKAVKKTTPRLAGSRQRGLVDGLTKEQHRARSEQLVQIPRSQRTPEQHLAFARSNAVLRGQAPPTKTVLPVGAAAAASTASTLKDAQDRRVRKATKGAMRPPEQGGVGATGASRTGMREDGSTGIAQALAGGTILQRLDRKIKGASALPVRQGSGSNGGMTPPIDHNPDITRQVQEQAAKTYWNNGNIQANDVAMSKATSKIEQNKLLKKSDRLHTERGKTIWPGLSDENARLRSVHDWQLRNGDITVGENWQRPAWYTGPAPKIGKQGGGSASPAGQPPSTPPSAPGMIRPGQVVKSGNLDVTVTKVEPHSTPGQVRIEGTHAHGRTTFVAPGTAPPKAPPRGVSMRQVRAELNAKDRKASEKLIARMPSMAPEHLQIAVDSPSTSQKVKDAARVELVARQSARTPGSLDKRTPAQKAADAATYQENVHPGDAALAPLAQAMRDHPPGSTSTQGGGPAFERKTFKGHGIKHGDTIEAHKYISGKGATVVKGTAHVKGAEIGIHDGEKLHHLGGVATKVMARKVDNPKAGLASEGASLDALFRLAQQVKDERAAAAPVAHPEVVAAGKRLAKAVADLDAVGGPGGNEAISSPESRNFLRVWNHYSGIALVNKGPLGDEAGSGNTYKRAKAALEALGLSGGSPVRGAHPEKFAPGQKPPVHKFMNTQRLQEIANSGHPEHAPMAREILAKRNKKEPQILPPGQQRGANALEKARDAAPAAPGLSNADKIKNAATMYGTGSPQHLEAQRRFGSATAAPGRVTGPAATDPLDEEMFKKGIPELEAIVRSGKSGPIHNAAKAELERKRALLARNRGGLSSTNPASKAMTERILAKRAEAAVRKEIDPATTRQRVADTGTIINGASHPRAKGAISKAVIALNQGDHRNAIRVLRDAADQEKPGTTPHKALTQAMQHVEAGKPKDRMPALPPGGNASADITAARAARGQVDTSQAGSSNAQFALEQTIYDRFPELKGKDRQALTVMAKALMKKSNAGRTTNQDETRLKAIERLLRLEADKAIIRTRQRWPLSPPGGVGH